MLLDSGSASIGWPSASFSLNDADGHSYNLNELKGNNGLVIAFICNHCPYVKAIAKRLRNDANTLQAEGINLVAINANDFTAYPEDSPAMMKVFSDKYQFDFPYLVDEDQHVAKTYGAVCTPDFFGFNQHGTLQYRGRIDDLGIDGDESQRTPELLNAMNLIVQTDRGPEQQMPSIGCSIKWR